MPDEVKKELTAAERDALLESLGGKEVFVADAPDPPTMRIKSAHEASQGLFVIIDSASFDPKQHTPYDEVAQNVAKRRRLRLKEDVVVLDVVVPTLTAEEKAASDEAIAAVRAKRAAADVASQPDAPLTRRPTR